VKRLSIALCFSVLACSSVDEGSISTLGAGQLSPDFAKRLSLEAVKARGTIGDVPATELTSVRGVTIDSFGEAHTRIEQTYQGVPVFGGEVVMHLRGNGQVKSVTDGLVRNVAVDTTPAIAAQQAVETAVQTVGGWANVSHTPKSDLLIVRAGRSPQLAWRVRLASLNSATPKMPVVFVSAAKGDVLWSYDNLQTAKNREVHNLNHGTTLPGAIARIEGQAVIGETDVDTNYDRLGSTYDCYKALFNRDSFDNLGAKLISSVHYSNNYVNAYWDGTQMVYGDGDNVNSRSLAISMDVTAHELTHAVTERTSNLTYSGESGGLNEAMSDIFGNVCEWHRDNAGNVTGPTSANTWMVGEDIWLAAPALRFMDDPARDGTSLDFYSSTAGNVDVHYSSGIANLAFYLLAHGGTHPRGKSTTVVTGIGIYDAARIFYRVNTVYLTPSSGFPDARVATVNAAVDLFGAGSAQAVQAGNAWTAVGVAAPPNYTVIDTKPNLSGATGASLNYSFATNGATAMKFVTSGGTGDSDIYVRFGAAPTLTTYDCRPYTSTTNETCEFNPAQSGTYYVMIQGYAAFSGVTLTTSAANAGGPSTETSCTDGIDNDGDGAVDCADSDCVGNAACVPTTETNCSDGVDNDSDGAIDCADSDCVGKPVCLPATETSCTDGVDNDGDGAIDCADSDCAGNAACAPTWVTISSHNFESGWGPYTDGGGDAARVNNATAASSGLWSAQLRDNSGAASAISTTTGMNLSAYSQMKIDYKYYAIGMEVGEDFFVEVWNGSTWLVVADRVRGTDFNNTTHMTDSLTVNLSTLTSKTAVKVRFRCDASDNSDQIYVDDIVVSAK
jgi:Zn-dependent metalloprotease